MTQIAVTAKKEGEEFQTVCECCHRPIYWGYGWLESKTAALAAY